jgi:hypothetical protein
MKPGVLRVLEKAFPGEEARCSAPISICGAPSTADAGAVAILDGTKTVMPSASWD